MRISLHLTLGDVLAVFFLCVLLLGYVIVSVTANKRRK